MNIKEVYQCPIKNVKIPSSNDDSPLDLDIKMLEKQGEYADEIVWFPFVIGMAEVLSDVLFLEHSKNSNLTTRLILHVPEKREINNKYTEVLLERMKSSAKRKTAKINKQFWKSLCKFVDKLANDFPRINEIWAVYAGKNPNSQFVVEDTIQHEFEQACSLMSLPVNKVNSDIDGFTVYHLDFFKLTHEDPYDAKNLPDHVALAIYNLDTLCQLIDPDADPGIEDEDNLDIDTDDE